MSVPLLLHKTFNDEAVLLNWANCGAISPGKSGGSFIELIAGARGPSGESVRETVEEIQAQVMERLRALSVAPR